MQRLHPYWIVMVVLFTFSCGQYNKVFKSKDPLKKYTMAMQLYKKKDYARAVQLFDQLRDMYKNSDSLETVYYYSAMSYYNLKDYPYAAMFFKDFTDNFTRSPKVIECAYMAIYCDYLNIGSYELDQSDSKSVMEAFQTFTNYYPDSEYTQKCNDMMDRLREKLQLKEYSHVIQYFKMGEYKATVTAARACIKLYPDIKQREELEYLIVYSQYLYAMNSIERKRQERLEEVIVNYDDYKYNNDVNSAHYKLASSIKQKALNEIAVLTGKHELAKLKKPENN